MSDDTLRLTKRPLPAAVKEVIGNLTKELGPEAKASIDARANGSFATLERADAPPQKK